jgi:hypothetical protein
MLVGIADVLILTTAFGGLLKESAEKSLIFHNFTNPSEDKVASKGFNGCILISQIQSSDAINLHKE